MTEGLNLITTGGEGGEVFEGEGRVRAFGEVWQARGEEPLEKGDRVEIVGVDGVWVLVARAS